MTCGLITLLPSLRPLHLLRLLHHRHPNPLQPSLQHLLSLLLPGLLLHQQNHLHLLRPLHHPHLLNPPQLSLHPLLQILRQPSLLLVNLVSLLRQPTLLPNLLRQTSLHNHLLHLP
ncbi:unknown [Tropheryma whipplei str. Twist]|uniref:Uncharacterized protein n=1 Tax=Tropheryma whipplei (strain Twist) TaxID=203267 RepID=Q83FT7_TROWT|nr:unknown [Tropheryma whipplei str. Twist]CAD67294.1 hypothetical protein TW630 [Tropheryma whipplei TW08/27]